MSTQLSMDNFSPLSRRQSSYDIAVALGMKPLPSSSSFYSHGGLDVYIPNTYPHRDHLHNSSHSSPYSYLNDSHSGFLPELPLYEGQPQALPPPHFAMRPQSWADNISQFPPHPPANASLLQNMSMFTSTSTAPHGPSMGDLPDAQATGTQPAWTLSGSLDPATGVFQRTPEHPRLRTAQACEKCRIRKAKCSGDRPSCQRCISRKLDCEYASERKMRGPNKTKRKSVSAAAGGRGPSPASSSERRMSIASSSSGSDEMGAAFNIPPAVVASRPLDEVNEPSPSHHQLSVPGFVHSPLHYAQTPIDPLLQDPVHHEIISPQRRPRPPPLNLGENHLFPNVQVFPPFDAPEAIPGPSFHPDDITTARRGSLPTYLMEYSPNDAASMYSQPRSNSASEGSMHTPLTPSSLPSFDDFIEFPRSFSSEKLSTVNDAQEDAERWATGSSDADETPRIGVENNLAARSEPES
ncbi:hypothetical protein BKA93DRAFT_824821 [Sparassis latifolia]